MKYFYCIFLLLSLQVSSQAVKLYEQFNGRFDFTFVGNTLQPEENSNQTAPAILDSSSATLNLLPTDQIEAAYLYWSGSGTGDFNVSLNGTFFNAERTFALQRAPIPNLVYDYFSGFANITDFVKQNGNNATYTFADLDNKVFLPSHFVTRTNFAGWAILVIYKNSFLPLNQLNIYDGLQNVPDAINITLTNLDVIDNQDARIGFIAWEGDQQLAVNESLRINGNLVSNLPLNPVTNAFNGTNSVTGANNMYNMDLDIYPIQNNIQIGDSSALIQLTSGQDFVMINTIITKLNSQLPDATIQISNPSVTCNSNFVNVNYTVNNFNSTDELIANVPISFYIGNQLVGQAFTKNVIPIGGSESGVATLLLSVNAFTSVEIRAVVDDNGTGVGIETEIRENNNTSNFVSTSLLLSPKFNVLDTVFTCNLGFSKGYFNFAEYETKVKIDPNHIVGFFTSEQNAINNVNPITNLSSYYATSGDIIWVRITDSSLCYSITNFELKTRNCPPVVYNAVSLNNDGINDEFYIEGLKDIFLNHQIEVYNRWGQLLWKGNQNKPFWRGEVEEQTAIADRIAPTGTYFYILYLNDPDYSEILKGYLYLKK